MRGAPRARLDDLGGESAPQEEMEEVDARNRLLDEEIKDRQQDRGERLRFARWTFYFLVGFVVVCLLFVLGSMLTRGLSDAVLITLITTSLATVVGVFTLVMKYLFNPRP